MKVGRAKFKLNESEYFLKRLTDDEIWNDDLVHVYYLNALLSSSKSIIDYVSSEFFDSLTPKISSNDWKFDKNYRDDNKKNHPQKKALNKFLEIFDEEKKNLKNDHLVYYFLKKRDKTIHEKNQGSKGGLYQILPGGTVYKQRWLEFPWAKEYLKKNPEKQIDFGDSTLSETKRDELEDKLRREDWRPHVEYYIMKLREFVDKFEKIDPFAI